MTLRHLFPLGLAFMMALTGCATPIYDGRLSWKQGWREGTVESISLDAKLIADFASQCAFDSYTLTNESLAVVRWKELSRRRWRIAKVPKDLPIQVTSAVYVNISDCNQSLEWR